MNDIITNNDIKNAISSYFDNCSKNNAFTMIDEEGNIFHYNHKKLKKKKQKRINGRLNKIIYETIYNTCRLI